MTAAICLIVKNEVNDLAEWIVHHVDLGFDRVIVYDNCSNDGTTELVRALQSVLPIDHHLWPKGDNANTQFLAYEDCISRSRGIYDWVAFIDCDEFLVPYGTNMLADLLSAHKADSAFALNWLIFGSSGLDALGGRMVMEAFTRRAAFDFEVNRHVKCFVRPTETTKVINPHSFRTTRPCVNLLGQEIVWSIPGLVERSKIVHGIWGGLHHYFVRTRQHWDRRVRRGQFDGSARAVDLFTAYDRNEEHDASAVKYGVLSGRRIEDLSGLLGISLRPSAPPLVIAPNSHLLT